MKPLLKKRVKHLVLLLFVIFVFLFAGRFTYVWINNVDRISEEEVHFERFESEKTNYASKRYNKKEMAFEALEIEGPVKGVDQKYEKIANIKSKSKVFEESERKTRAVIKKYNALIQYEKKKGNKGRRTLNMIIGVPPESFDSVYLELLEVAQVVGKDVTKTDKTNEYKELNARKAALTKKLNSLYDLKSKEGEIEDFIDLENTILDVERDLQALGISLGDFDDENAFCTVRFALSEYKVHVIHKASLIKCMHRAFKWSTGLYLNILGIAALIVFLSFILLFTIEKIRAMVGYLKEVGWKFRKK